MTNGEQGLAQLKLAYANVAQLKQLAQDIESTVRGDPGEAEEFIRPCTQLLQKLLEAQGSIETLLEKLFVAGRVELASRR
jgi:hypothetical protein